MIYFKYSILGLIFSIMLHAEDVREITFSVYGQYPVRGVAFEPIGEAALAQGVQAQPTVEIKTHTLSRIGPYSYKGGSRIAFNDLESGQEVGSVSVTNNSDLWLFIFVKNPNYKKDPQNNPRYLIYPFDDSRKNLPNNGLVFLNISGKELDGLLENRRVSFGAGQSGRFRVQESLPVNLWTRDFSGERLLPALIKTYRFQPNHRYLMIFFPPVLRGSADLDVRFLAEAVE